MINVTCAIIIEKGKILITQNDQYSDHPLKWEFPGGKIDDGETPEDCIVREINEELDLKIKVVGTLQSIDYDYKIKQIRLIPFLCTINDGAIMLKEHRSYAWKNLQELSEVDFSEADKELILRSNNRVILEEYIGEKMY